MKLTFSVGLSLISSCLLSIPYVFTAALFQVREEDSVWQDRQNGEGEMTSRQRAIREQLVKDIATAQLNNDQTWIFTNLDQLRGKADASGSHFFYDV